ncbi:hypothetical protein, partial [Noviherbaspirillum autotrophicum]|uniref:hypothetical protein n=1 Tax=Noviherbaspirillum autotrophicum TaxID=709839 RepID=UPI001E4B97E2
TIASRHPLRKRFLEKTAKRCIEEYIQCHFDIEGSAAPATDKWQISSAAIFHRQQSKYPPLPAKT